MNIYAERMLIAKLKPYREFDRAAQPLHGPDYVERLRQSIRKHGVQEELILHYDPVNRVALLGEGNHRLWLAEEAGYADIPVVATAVEPRYLSRRPAVPVPGVPYLTPEPGHGYFPVMFRSSQVFPAAFFAEMPVRLIPGIDYIPYGRRRDLAAV